jgi:UDP-3-O-[3-hydroxymyristoyl] glucosamine N-acyltransferase
MDDDVSMNNRLFVSNDVSLNNRLYVGSNTILVDDVSMNNRLFVSNDVSLNNSLYVGSNTILVDDVSMNNRLFVEHDVSLNNRLYVGSNTILVDDVSMNNRLFVSNDVSLNNRLYVGSNTIMIDDVSMNNRLFVSNDVSLNNRLYVGSNTIMVDDVSMNNRLFVNNDVSLNNRLYVGSNTILVDDVSMNNRLFVSNDVSLNNRLYVGSNTILIDDVSMNNRLFVSNDVSLNNRLYVGSNTIMDDDVSMNNRLFVSNDVSLNNRLYVGSNTIMVDDVSMNNRLFVGDDASFNSNVFIRNDLSVNGAIRANEIELDNDLTVKGILTVYKDVSMNNRLFVSNDVSLNNRLYVGSNTILVDDVSMNNRLFIGGDASFNQDIFVNGNIKAFGGDSLFKASDDTNSTLSIASNNGKKSYIRLSEVTYNSTKINEYGGYLKYDGHNLNNNFHIGTINNGTDTDRISINKDNGNVGIGTTNPSYNLQVHDGIITSNYTASSILHYYSFRETFPSTDWTKSSGNKVFTNETYDPDSNTTNNNDTTISGFTRLISSGYVTSNSFDLSNYIFYRDGTEEDGKQLTNSRLLLKMMGKSWSQDEGQGSYEHTEISILDAADDSVIDVIYRDAGNTDGGPTPYFYPIICDLKPYITKDRYNIKIRIKLLGPGPWDYFDFKDVSICLDDNSPWYKDSVYKQQILGGASIGVDYVGQELSNNELLVQGNVGIGTTNPSKKLHVVGDAFVTGDISLNTHLSVDGNSTFNGNNTFNVDTNNSKNFTVKTVYNNLPKELITITDVSSVQIHNLITTGKVISKEATLQEGDATFNDNVMIHNDLSLNGKLFVGGDASFNENVFITGTNKLKFYNNNHYINYDNGSLNVYGSYAMNHTAGGGGIKLFSNQGKIHLTTNSTSKGVHIATNIEYDNVPVTIGTSKDTANNKIGNITTILGDASFNQNVFVNGNVGIGKTDPQVALDISGQALFGNTVGSKGTATRNFNVIGPDAVLRVARNHESQHEPAIELLHLSPNGNTTNSYWDLRNTDDNRFSIRERTDLGNPNDYLNILGSNGNVGIGITNPQSKLVIDGSLNVIDDVSFNQRLSVGGDVSMNNDVDIGGNLTVTGNNFNIGGTDGANFTWNGVNKLKLNDDFQIDSNKRLMFRNEDNFITGNVRSGNQKTFDIYGNNEINIISKGESGDGIKFYTDSNSIYTNERMVIDKNGDVSMNGILKVIGDVSFNQKLYVNGDVSMNGSLNVVGDVSFNQKLSVGGDASFNEDVFISGDLSLNQDLSMNGVLYAVGGSKLVVQGGQNGGPGRGIYMWNENNSNNAIYMGQPGTGKSLSGGNACTGANFQAPSFPIRFRTLEHSGYGFIFENSSEQLLSSIRGSDGSAYFKGDVGIGVTNPSKKLEIAGDISLNQDLYIDTGRVIKFNNDNITLTHSADTLTFDGTNEDASLLMKDSNKIEFDGNHSFIHYDNSNSNDRIKFYTDKKLQLSGNNGLNIFGGSSGTGVEINSANTTNGIKIGSAAAYDNIPITIGKSKDTANSIVGNKTTILGDLSLNEKLSVNGDASFNGDVHILGNIKADKYNSEYIINTTVNNYTLMVTDDLSLNGNLLVKEDASFNQDVYVAGNVGIGITNPQIALDINATNAIRIPVGTTSERSNFTHADGQLRYNSTNSQFEGYSDSKWSGLGGVTDGDKDTYISAEIDAGFDNDQLKFFVGDTNNTSHLRMIIDTNGDVSMNNNLLILGDLSLNGKLRANGICEAQSFNALSDSRLKTNVQIIDNAISKINQLKGVSYNWINDSSNTVNLGLIAQDTEEIIPEVVMEREYNDKLKFAPKSIDYNGIIPILIESVKELSTENIMLKDKITTLENTIESIKQDIINMKNP